MNYCFITKEGDPLPICDRLRDEGKRVLVGMVQGEASRDDSADREKTRLSLYDGILEKKPAEEVIVFLGKMPAAERDNWWVGFDYGDLWELSERVLGMGFRKGIFPTEAGYKLEEDRTAGKSFAKKHYPDLKVAPASEFSKVEDAIKFLEQNKDKIYVLKSEGSNAETVVPATQDAELARRQIIGALQAETADYEKGFTLEEKIRNPIELSPVLLFMDGKPLFSLVELENKPLGAGNIGRLTGGCQNLTIATRMDCELNKIAFPPIVYELAEKQPGISIFDAGLLFDGNDFWFTEFAKDRWGWDGIFSEIAMSGDVHHRMAASRHFDLIARGQNPLQWNFGAAVRLFQTQPDSKRVDVFEDEYAVDWLDEASDGLWFYCIKKQKGQFVSVGYRKDLGVATGAGNTMEEAVNRAYKAAESVAMTGLYFRPKFDMLSRDYFDSILNRYDWLMQSGLL
jgi:hypothetical protein